jgi:hypothetical protein
MKSIDVETVDEMPEGQEDLYFSKEISNIFRRKLTGFIFFVYLFPQLTSILAFILNLLNVHIGIIIPIMIIGPLASLIFAIIVRNKIKKFDSE